MKINSLLELVIALKSATKEESRKLADDNPDYRCTYATSFADEILEAKAKDGIGDGSLGSNIGGLDEILNLSNKWKRACKHCPPISLNFMPNCLNTSKISDSIWGEKKLIKEVI